MLHMIVDIRLYLVCTCVCIYIGAYKFTHAPVRPAQRRGLRGGVEAVAELLSIKRNTSM